MSKKMPVALVIYLVLALLAWTTLDGNIPVQGRDIPLRAVTVAIIALFFLRTLLHWRSHRDQEARERGQDL